MTHAKTQRRKEKRKPLPALAPNLQIGNAFVFEAPASTAWLQTQPDSRAARTNAEHLFAPLRLCVRLKNLPPRSLRGTLHWS